MVEEALSVWKYSAAEFADCLIGGANFIAMFRKATGATPKACFDPPR